MCSLELNVIKTHITSMEYHITKKMGIRNRTINILMGKAQVWDGDIYLQVRIYMKKRTACFY